MLVRKPLIFFTLVFAIVAVFAVTEVVAQPCASGENTADYECNDGVQDNYTVRIVKPFPDSGPCTSFAQGNCSDFTNENCSKYSWEISPAALSHFNLLVESQFADKICASNGDPLDCDGSGDSAQGADRFGQFLTWNCLLKFGSNIATPYVIVRGEFGSAPTDWQVKETSDFANGDYGITQGLAELFEPAPAGGVIFKACVNWYGDEKTTIDDVSFDVIRRNDARGCIETLRACVGIGCTTNCTDVSPEDLAGFPNYISSGILSGQTCDNEAVNVRHSSPWYLYEVVSGGYVFRSCLDLGNYQWEPDIRCCTVGQLYCDSL